MIGLSILFIRTENITKAINLMAVSTSSLVIYAIIYYFILPKEIKFFPNIGIIAACVVFTFIIKTIIRKFYAKRENQLNIFVAGVFFIGTIALLIYQSFYEIWQLCVLGIFVPISVYFMRNYDEYFFCNATSWIGATISVQSLSNFFNDPNISYVNMLWMKLILILILMIIGVVI